MGFTRKALCLSAFLALSWIAPAGAQAPADPGRDLALTYRIYYSGLEVIRLGVDIRLARGKYEMDMNFRTLGMIGTLFPWTMKAYAKGRLTEDGIRPVAAGQRNSWRGRHRWVELRYPGRSPVVADVHPAAKDDKPSAKSLIDTIDLASAIFAVTRQLDQKKGCDQRLPVFDGRRRYDLLFKALGDSNVHRTHYSVYAGPAIKCRVEMDRLAGFKTRRKSYGGWGEEDRAATIFMGRPFKDAPPVPVRIELQTRWGDVMAHLTKAELAGDGKKQELARLR